MTFQGWRLFRIEEQYLGAQISWVWWSGLLLETSFVPRLPFCQISRMKLATANPVGQHNDHGFLSRSQVSLSTDAQQPHQISLITVEEGVPRRDSDKAELARGDLL